MSAMASMTLSGGAIDFIDDGRLAGLIANSRPDAVRVREIIARSLEKQPLTVEETAALVATADRDLVEEIFEAARRLKRDVYGNRIVLFVPLYVGNQCVNDCLYCGFRRSNAELKRVALTMDEIANEVRVLEREGQPPQS